MDYTSLIGPAVVAAVISSLVAAIGFWLSAHTAKLIHGERLAFEREQTERQLKIAREKLRHDLYKQRFEVYMAFHELLVAFGSKDEVEVEFRNALAASAHSSFLFETSSESICGVCLMRYFPSKKRPNVCDEAAWSSPAERIAAAAQIGQDRLRFLNQIDKLAENFRRFLHLEA